MTAITASSSPPPVGRPTRPSARLLLPIGVLAVAYGLLGLTLTGSLSHQEIMQRCVLVDPSRSRLWSVGNVEVGLAYLGVFAGMLFYFLRTYSDSRAHVRDLGLALAYLLGSFALDFACVQLLHPFPALLIGDAVVITFTALVSRQNWFQRLLGIFVPLVFLTCGVGHLLEGMSYWKLTYPVNVPWTMVTADIGFAILLNASRFPAFIRGEDVVESLAAERARADALQEHAKALQEQIDVRTRAEHERLQADEARRESEGLYRTLFETMSQGVVYQDAGGAITAANPAAERLLGLTLDQMRGRTSADTRWRAMREDGSDLPAEDHPTMVALHTGRAVRDSVMGVFHPLSEETRWLRVSATPEFREGGSVPWRTYALFEDVTERKRAESVLNESYQHLRESEQRLRLALEGGRLGTWDLDLTTGDFHSVSATFKSLYGLGPDEDFTVAARNRAIHPKDLHLLEDAIREATQTRITAVAEFRIHWADGSEHWLRAHGQAVYSGQGLPERVIGATQDITAQKAYEADREAKLADAIDRADHDPLTRLWNHATFHRYLGEETERAWRENTTLAVVLLDLDNFKFFNDAYGYAVGNEVLLQVTAWLRGVSRPYDTVARFGGDEFALILPGMVGATSEGIEERLRKDMRGLTYRPQGQEAAIPITMSVGAALLGPIGSGEGQQGILRLAEERLQRSKTGADAAEEIDKLRRVAEEAISGFSMLDALVTAVDNKDRYTRRHSEDVMTYSLIIARQLGLDAETQHRIAVAALLHDVGKIGVPDAILRKPDKLTSEEFEAIKQHPQMGAVIVQAVPGLEDTLDAVRHHHERWDGKGYPLALRGEETPLMARLMAVADAFSAMTMDRPYRRGMETEKAVSILRTGAGTQWDPQCVTAFLDGLVSGRDLIDNAVSNERLGG